MLAFTFPGQGSQHEGMGEAWVDHPSWELVDEASAACDRDIAALLLRSDADTLKATNNAQMSTFVLSMVILDAVARVGVDAAYLAGHSLGEYTALTASGTLDFGDAVRLVDERGHAMLEAAEAAPGTMAAVLGLDDDKVEAACARAMNDVWAANFNAPGQVVIAGSANGVAAASEFAKELGARRVLPLAVGGAFHTPFMAPARTRLVKAIGEVEFRAPSTPVAANVDAQLHGDADLWGDLLAAQLTAPVRWRHTLGTLADEGVTTFVELGPGSALTGMAKRTVTDSRLISISTPSDVDKLLSTLASDAPAVTQQEQEGEHLFVSERIVVSPGAGIFAAVAGLGTGCRVAVGEVIGHVGDVEIRSPFAGEVRGVMAVEGERVAKAQPIAWLRVT